MEGDADRNGGTEWEQWKEMKTISLVGTEARSGVASSVPVIIRCWLSSPLLQTVRVRLFEGHGPLMESATASTETSVENNLTIVVLRSVEA